MSPLARLATWTFRRRRTVVGAWLVALVAAFGLATQLGGEWSADYSTPGSESKAAAERLTERFPGQSPETIDVVWRADDAGGSAARAQVDGVLREARGLEGIARGAAPPAPQVSPDGRTALVRLPLAVENASDVPAETGTRLIELAEGASRAGVQVAVTGQAIVDAQQGAVSSEGVGLLIAAFVLLLTFGSVVAAGLPLITALFGLGVSTAVVMLLAAVVDTPDWAESVAAMIGIGVGIDYALLILTRFRAAVARGLTPRDATVEAIATAGRSALIAGGTVVISLMGLFLVGLTYLYGVALSAIAAVLIVMVASVTLLPALLGFFGGRLERLRLPGVARREAADPASTPAARWSRVLQRRPLLAAFAGVALLLALAAPVADLRLGFPDRGNDAEGTMTRAAYDLTRDGFGAGAAGPLLMVADGEDRAALTRLVADVREEPGVAAVAAPVVSPDGSTALVSVVSAASPQDPATEELVSRLRSHDGVQVGGATASLVDQSDAVAARMPVFIGGVVALSFLLLLVAFRSPLVAVKAGVLNLLSIGAAYGVVAAFASGGALGGLIGIDTATPVPPFIPVIMFAILFGLSMDYEVFLLSRIREEYLGGKATSEAVSEGLARTARVITAAAAIMVAVFGAFVLSPEVFLKLIGVGLATAVLIDATVVRMVLVPAVMQLMGDRSWWLPRWLDRLIPRTELEPAASPV